jgi:integrase
MNKKRSHGEGSIYKLPSGKWRGQLTINGKRLSKISYNRKEIAFWIRKTIGQVEAGLTYDSARITGSDYLLHWLTGIKNGVRPTTYDHYELLITRHLIPKLGDILIKDLTADRIQFAYDEWIEAGLGIPTLLKIHQVLHTALERAVKTGILIQNPAHYVSRPKEPSREMKFWTESESNQFLSTARDNRLYCLFHLALATGARQSELLGLQWKDLEWVRGILHIQRQLSRQGDLFAPLKTKAGKRSIELGANTLAALQEHYKKQDLERKIAGSSWKENDLIFTTKSGAAMHQKNLLDHYFNPLVQLANVPAIRFHDLRHTAVALMLSHGVSVFIVSKIIGHARPSITSDIYGHLVPGATSGIGQMMDDLIAPISIPVGEFPLQSHTDCTQIAHEKL